MQDKRDGKGRFLKGVSGNPGGAARGPKQAIKEIQEAIEAFEKEHGVSYWKAATVIAMKLAREGNTSLLGKIMDKFVPSKIEGTGFDTTNYTQIFSGISTGDIKELVDALRTRIC